MRVGGVLERCLNVIKLLEKVKTVVKRRVTKLENLRKRSKIYENHRPAGMIKG